MRYLAVIIRSPTEPNPAYIIQRHDPALATYQPTSIVICTSINATCIRSDVRAYVALQWVGGVLLCAFLLWRSGRKIGAQTLGEPRVMSEDEEPSKSPVRAGRNDGVTLSLSQSRSARGAGAPEGTHASVSNNDDGRQCSPPYVHTHPALFQLSGLGMAR